MKRSRTYFLLVKERFAFFSSFGIREVENLDDEKAGGADLRILMTLNQDEEPPRVLLQLWV